jgi:hypothetical protein
MKYIIYSLKKNLTFDNFPYLTILANLFLGYALGRIFMTPGGELGESLLTKVFLVIGTCFFFNYLLCLRKAFTGIIRNANGRLRPFLRDAVACAGLNALIFVLATTLFFLKSNAA